jgi:hypothetical protein
VAVFGSKKEQNSFGFVAVKVWQDLATLIADLTFLPRCSEIVYQCGMDLKTFS